MTSVDRQLADWAAFQSLWHWRGGFDVSPVEQLAAWHDGDPTDAQIATDLKEIAHLSTSQPRRPGEPALWLRIDDHGPILDILGDEQKQTIGTAELVATIRRLMEADDPPEFPGTTPDGGTRLVDIPEAQGSTIFDVEVAPGRMQRVNMGRGANPDDPEVRRAARDLAESVVAAVDAKVASAQPKPTKAKPGLSPQLSLF